MEIISHYILRQTWDGDYIRACSREPHSFVKDGEAGWLQLHRASDM